MRPIGTFRVRASLPAPLAGLRALAYNLHWSWTHESIALFRRLDPELWERVGHNPVRLLDEVAQERLDAAAADEAFLAHLDTVARALDQYTGGASTWFKRAHGRGDPTTSVPGSPVPGSAGLPPSGGPLVAYLSAEFGVTECLPIFAGGLGVLAGDHLKGASDLGVPLVGVGLIYQEGYFHQQLSQAGWQQESYAEHDFRALPLALEMKDGRPLRVPVPHPGRDVLAQVWRADVGRVPLYLLDTNLPDNRPEDRDITDRLYGGDLEMRIRQELVLGIGGVRALAALGKDCPVYHMNEGHSAFAALERVRRLIEAHGLSFDAAREVVAAGTVFTTHTPVPAGHDAFPSELVERYLGGYIAPLGLEVEDLVAMGRLSGEGTEPFSMPVFALRMAGVSNGVSRLHGRVSRGMWRGLWPGLPEREIPVGHVTNGVHLPSWISWDMNELYDRYLGPRWREEPGDPEVWQRADRIPSEELWRTHERRRERLVSFARRRLRRQLTRRGASEATLRIAAEVLDPAALTIGFARRFATYKRALLLFREPDRLSRLLNDADRPVQVVIAGKAHPRDDAGKALIQRIVELVRLDEFRRRVVFLENYDLPVARYLVQGADVWLNTPRRPLEASGTSGMKAAANGGLNLSVLDGWWAEAWELADGQRTTPGWAIGRGEEYADHEEQDRIEADALYALLETDVVPTFYDRGGSRIPRAWVERMKQSIGRLSPLYNTTRVVGEYTDRYYVPGAERARVLAADGGAAATALAEWKRRVAAGWPAIRVGRVLEAPPEDVAVDSDFSAAAEVYLGDLSPADVEVQLCLGPLGPRGGASWEHLVPMARASEAAGDPWRFEVRGARCPSSGPHGYTIRVVASYPGSGMLAVPGLITWATEAMPAPEPVLAGGPAAARLSDPAEGPPALR